MCYAERRKSRNGAENRSGAGVSMTTITIRNVPNNAFVRFGCTLCGGSTDKQAHLFELPDRQIVCDDCAEHPELIHERVRAKAAVLRAAADAHEAMLGDTYVVEVVPVPSLRSGARLGPILRFLRSRHYQSQLLVAKHDGLVFLTSMPYTDWSPTESTGPTRPGAMNSRFPQNSQDSCGRAAKPRVQAGQPCARPGLIRAVIPKP